MDRPLRGSAAGPLWVDSVISSTGSELALSVNCSRSVTERRRQ
jgi:hypothetical protein